MPLDDAPHRQTREAVALCLIEAELHRRKRPARVARIPCTGHPTDYHVDALVRDPGHAGLLSALDLADLADVLRFRAHDRAQGVGMDSVLLLWTGVAKALRRDAEAMTALAETFRPEMARASI